MLIDYVHGQTGIVLRIVLRSSSSSSGAGLTGLDHTSSGLIISTIADVEATATPYTVAASNVETITTLGTYEAPTSGKCRFKAVDGTNHPGLYEIQLPNTRFAVSGAKEITFSIHGAANLAQCDFRIPLRTVNPYVAGGKLPVTLASTDVTGNVAADVQTIKTQTVTCSAGVTVLASVGTSTASAAQSGDSFARIGSNGAGLTSLGDTRLANLDATVSSRLAPTTSGRTLDVTAGGCAGIDWANVEAPTTTIDLSGTTVGIVTALTGKTGFSLASSGLDAITVETGVNARQALSVAAAALGGVLSGAGTGTITVRAAANSGTTRITATTDSSGNRSAVTLALPS